jgi:hypothetical protein
VTKGDKGNKMKKDLLAYCGFYCGDCLGYTGVIADAAEGLKAVLEKYKFERTAKCIFTDQLKDYDEFFAELIFMTGLKCPMACRERKDDNIACEVRECCISKGFYACYECSDFEMCDKLRVLMDGLHYNSIIENLRDIKAMGLKEWNLNGKRHHYWDKKD